MTSERRDTLRVPDRRLITEFVGNHPDVASIVNLSSTGIYTVKTARNRRIRGPRKIQMEIPVHEACESIWTMGEIVFERVGMSSIGSGVRFLDMAERHKKLLQELIEARRRELLDQMIEVAQTQRHLSRDSAEYGVTAPPRKITRVMHRITA